MRKMIRVKDILGEGDSPGLLGVGRTTFWKWVRQGKIPKPMYPKPKIPVWFEDEIKRALEKIEAEHESQLTLEEILGNPKKGIAGCIPMSQTTWRRLRRSGDAPEPLGYRSGKLVWRRSDVETFVEMMALERDEKTKAEEKERHEEDLNVRQLPVPGTAKTAAF